MSENKIEGIPEGWELIEIGSMKNGDMYISCDGIVQRSLWTSSLKHHVIVRKIEPPKPTYVPWTFDTMPDCVRVKAKEDGTRFMALPLSDSNCLVKTQSYAYEYLFDHFTQLDGTPCGTVEVHE